VIPAPAVVGGVTLGAVTLLAVLPASAATPDVRVLPLAGDRVATVVSVRARAGVVVVAFPSGQTAAIHSQLRSLKPGSRVRVEGIKWGTPTAGIKWAKPPRGIRWGIKWSRSGVFASQLRSIGTSGPTRVRGIVVRRFPGGVSVGTRGGVVPIRVAVWLPGIKRTTTNPVIPSVGDVIDVDVNFTTEGRLTADGVRIVPTRTRPELPISGRLRSVSSERRTAVVRNVEDPDLPLEREIRIPAGVDLARLELGREIASTSTLTADGSLRAATIAPNDSFEAANDPANQIVAPPPANATTVELLRQATDRWVGAGTINEVSNRSVYDTGLGHLQRATAAAEDGDLATALTEAQAFRTLIIVGVPLTITPTVAADELALIGAAIAELGG
jgi:hypothetical protein